MTPGDAYLASIREENLAVYRASPGRLKEDVGQEAEIAHDYRGRLVYELLQNADDAMQDGSGDADLVVLRLTDDELWVGNTGRPLTEPDVAGLCGIGASAKSEHTGPRRASIGHKGMGFKSVLEITATPEAYSTGFRFRMDASLALAPVRDVMRSAGRPTPDLAPAMRFPWPVATAPAVWDEMRRGSGVNTLFRFPLRPELSAEQRGLLATRLSSLPLTAILFLKHLEHVRIEVDTADVRATRSLSIRRQELTLDGWAPAAGLTSSGTYLVDITEEDEASWSFLLGHDTDIPLSSHRGGLDPYAWDGIEFTEASVAAPHPASGMSLPPAWRRFHVFLPTTEPTPWGMLVNGAFATDLSRQEIRVGDESDDYNRFLIGEVATLFRDRLLPALQHEGASVTAILGLLDRDEQVSPRRPAAELHAAIAARLTWLPLLPVPAGRAPIAIGRTLVPPSIGGERLGPRLRELLTEDAGIDVHRLPVAELCSARFARILADLGAHAATIPETAELLANADPEASGLAPHPATDAVRMDPVLDVLTELWSVTSAQERQELVGACKRLPLFPVAVDSTGHVTRVAVDGATCFYPPRRLVRDVPLAGLQFLLHDICWGTLTPRDRNELMRDRMAAWKGLFDIQEFAFAEVMRASVLPSLELDADPDGGLRASLETLDRLAAICQLSGRTPKPIAPLPYERLGSDRALFNLARLPVPCRGDSGGVRWVPAFRAYFGADWIGDGSVELIETALEEAEIPPEKRPRFDYVVSPGQLSGLLSQYADLQQAGQPGDSEDEVSLDEDESAALEHDEKERWVAFLSWIGVNRALRPIHFHDVEDRGSGWLTTRDLVKPKGAAFAPLGKVWDSWSKKIRVEVGRLNADSSYKTFFTRVHVLDHMVKLAGLAATDATATIADALYTHLARNWGQLERFARLEVALVPKERDPGSRTKPPRPAADEVHELNVDFWLAFLRNRAIVPTRHGPRKPVQAWLPSAEASRRFGRRQQHPGDLLPLVDVPATLQEGRGRAFALALGIRSDLTPATFKPTDAQLIMERISERYGAAAADGSLEDEALRRAIRPAYRHVFELLVGSAERESQEDATVALKQAPLLVTDGAGRYRFSSGRDVLYADRPGMRERLGSPNDLWLFVLEATPSARAPLTRLFGVRTMDTEIGWRPLPGEPALDRTERVRFNDGMRALRPYLLSRLRVERSEDQQAATDLRRLDRFIESVELVDRLEITAFLDDRELSTRALRPSFVDLRDPPNPKAFVRWGVNGWPPSGFEAEALASALAELYQANVFEPFLTLIQAHSDELRRRLLSLAGASTDLAGVLADVADDPIDEDPLTGLEHRTAPGVDPDDVTGEAPERDPNARIPLFAPGQLAIEGTPQITSAAGGQPTDGSHSTDGTKPSMPVSRAAGTYRSLTNLDELNRVGMSVAIAYEHARLARLGILDPASFVFDVSTPKAYDDARRMSSSLDDAVAWLRDHGLDPGWPGFDIFTLDPMAHGRPNRLIELKSSGVNATTQTMTWNEWKSAKHGEIRSFFWLYLAGNLRSDLAHSRPFVRAIPDPFATLWSEVETKVRRSIQLNLLQFERSEFLELTVVATDVDGRAQEPPSPPG